MASRIDLHVSRIKLTDAEKLSAFSKALNGEIANRQFALAA
jgi:hypothetical protein